MINQKVKPALQEWRESWLVVLAACVGLAVGSVHTFSLGIMIAPLEAEFSWTRAQITSGLFIASLIAVPLAPFMGFAIDRFGPRRIALPGMTIFCVALGLLSTATEAIWSWWLLWGLLAIALVHIKPTVWVTAVSSLFTTSRGMAIAVVLSSTGICSFLTPMITFYLVENHGWRMAYVLLGGGCAVLALPLLYCFFSSLKDRQRSALAAGGGVGAPVPVLTGMGLREGFTSSAFYKLAGAVFLMTLANVALTVNLVPVLSFTGLTRENAAVVAGMVGISQIVGRLLGGYLLDRFNARIVAGIAVLLPVATCLILLGLPGSLAAAMVAVVILGLAAGAELDAVAYLAARYFGMRNFGTLFGTMSGLLTLGVGIGPVLASHVYDITQSYNPVLWGFIPLTVISSLLFLLLGAYPDFSVAGTEEAGDKAGASPGGN